MRRILNFIFVLFIYLCFSNLAFCEESVNIFDEIINKSELKNSATISVSIKKADKNNVIYERESKKLLLPASTLKLITMAPMIETLGDKYLFKTQFYYDDEKNLYIKLGADPYLTSEDLKNMLLKLKDAQLFPLNNIYIDSSIMDGIEWGIGWMWDNETNQLMQKYSAYNLDQNLMQIRVEPQKEGEDLIEGEPAKIISSNSATTTIMNYVKTSREENNIYSARFNWISPNILYLQGTISEATTLNIPTSSPQAYFLTELKKHLKNIGISYQKIQYEPLPEGKKLLTEKVSGVERAVIDILQKSKNFISETLLKIASHSKTNNQGSTIEGIQIINDYYKNINLSKNPRFYIVDASGVSHNNLITTDFMTDALIYNKGKSHYEFIKSRLATPDVGTMKGRLLDCKDLIWVKTGTLSGISGITGYAKSKKGDEYVFSILIQNYTQDSSVAKQLEDEIIRAIVEL